MSKKSSKRGRKSAWISKELLAKLEQEKDVYGMWQNGQGTSEEYKNSVRVRRDATRKAKFRMEFNLSRDVNYNEKGFFKNISSKKKTRETVDPLLNETDVLVKKDTQKVKLQNAFFASVFTAKASFGNPRCWRQERKS